MPIDDFIKDIDKKALMAVQDRLKKEKPNGKHYTKPDKSQFHTALHAAVKANSPALVDALLGAAADVTAVDHNNDTPLHWVSLSNDKDAATIADALLKKKVKVDALDKANMTPLHLAAQRGASAVIPALSAAGGEAALESLAPGKTPLMLAAGAGHMETVAALIKAGAKLGAQDASGCTALMQLLQAGKLSDARALLSHGDCNVNAVMISPPGHSALMMGTMGLSAGAEVDMALVEALLAQGASPDLQDATDKVTPIMWAITSKKDDLALKLIKATKQVDLRSKSGQTALSLALSSSADDSLVGALLAAGADPTTDGTRLLRDAMDKKRDGLAAEFIRVMKESQLNALGLDFKTLASSNLPKAALAYVSRFEKEQSDKYPVDNEGNTNLHILAEAGAPYDLIRGLIAMGLGPSTANKSGDTPLHIAARAGHVEVCRALVDSGADVLKRNGKNRRAREQPKIPDSTRDYLAQAEDEAKERKANKQSELWDDKMRATQTESAVIIRGL